MTRLQTFPVLLFLTLASCAPKPDGQARHSLVRPWVGWIPAGDIVGESQSQEPVALLTPSASPVPTQPLYGTPTPDPFRDVPAVREEEVSHIVQWGESLSGIAAQYQVSPLTISRANGLLNSDFLQAGQWLRIPPPDMQAAGPAYKIIPDSELVKGPSSIDFDIYGEVSRAGGYLTYYSEEVEGTVRSGAAIVDLVSRRYSVNPRLLLAVLDYQSGWVSETAPKAESVVYPLGFTAYGWEGLFSQLSWAADQLNLGYYRWRAGWAGPYLLPDGQVIMPGQGINAGTAGVQQLFASIYAGETWRQVTTEEGFFRFFNEMYGNPFERRLEPQIPDDLSQPKLQLPFEKDKTWSYTGGPHPAWGDWAAWAAVDFAPPGFAYGCVPSNEWVVASANGVVVRSEDGEVLLDLDGDGFEQTGWVLLYMHIESRERISVGEIVRAGDRLGHPSCEGGVTTGTHLHLSRKYNGEWIPADGPLPFNLDGWISSGSTYVYDGYFTRGDQEVEACACRNDTNQIQR